MNGQDFLTLSKEIANEFLQNIVFIDDEAFNKAKDKDHDLDPLEISKSFARSKKICAVYNPLCVADIEDLTEVSKKADITVIDWRINLPMESEEDEDSEEDIEEDDPRGGHTLRVIKSILDDPTIGEGSLKLILIYTGETDLQGITERVYDFLNQEEEEGFSKSFCEVSAENIRILVIAKPQVKFSHLPELEKRIVQYKDLPDFILSEFTKMTSGLLSNYILKSISIIRQNTFRLVSLFNKEMDAAFLLHRALLPNPEDSQDHLNEMLTDSIGALLAYNTADSVVNIENLIPWIRSRSIEKEVLIGNKAVNFNESIAIDSIERGFLKAIQSKAEDLEIPKKKLDSFSRKDHSKEYPNLFVAEESGSKHNEQFSILSHQKSNLKLPSIQPKLTLGTIIKQVSGSKNGYFLCMQAKCDSVRLSSERKFIFLPLYPVPNEKKFQFVVEEAGSFVNLALAKGPFELRTIKFAPSSGFDSIVAQLKNKKIYFFKSIYDEEFLWIADLKDSHAQRAAHRLASKLSRVGLDESEWLRRSRKEGQDD